MKNKNDKKKGQASGKVESTPASAAHSLPVAWGEPGRQVTDISSLDECPLEEQTDLIVAIILGDVSAPNLPTEDVHDALVNSAHRVVATLTCTDGVTVETLKEYEVEDYLHFLEGDTPAERLKQISSWDDFTEDELKKLTREATLMMGQGDSFSVTEYYELKDSRGRAVYYCQDSNDDLGMSHPGGQIGGPFTSIDKEDEPEHLDEYGNLISYCYYGD